MQRLRESIHTALAHVSKGWFNLEETSFEVYSVSKLKKLMELVKFAMQVYIHTVNGYGCLLSYHISNLSDTDLI